MGRRTSPIREFFHRAAAVAGLCAVFSVFASPPVRAAENSPEAVFRDIPALTSSSKRLEAAQRRFEMAHPEITLVILDRDKTDFIMGETGAPEQEALIGAIYNKARAPLEPSFYIQATGVYEEGDASSLRAKLDPEGKLLCVVMPRDPNRNTISKLKSALETVVYRDLIPGRLFNAWEFDNLGLRHELGHCLDNRYIAEYMRRGFSGDTGEAGWEAFTLQHKAEIFADLMHITQTLEEKGDWRRQLEDLRLFRLAVVALDAPVYATSYHLQRQSPKRVGPIYYHTAPALTALEKRIEDIGEENFRQMGFEKKREILYEITERSALTAEEMQVMGDFFERGDTGESGLYECVRYFLDHMGMAVNKAVADEDAKGYEAVPAAMVDNRLARAREALGKEESALSAENRFLRDSYTALVKDAPAELSRRAAALGGLSQENLQQAAASWMDDMRDSMEQSSKTEPETEARIALLRALIREGYLARFAGQLQASSAALYPAP